MAQLRNKQPTYDRTWEEIEDMLNQSIHMRNAWLTRYEKAKRRKDKTMMMDSVRNVKALEGVIKTLKWTIGTPGIEDPLS